MKRILRAAALLVLVTGICIWIATGRRLGWSQTSVPQTRKDPVTDIEYVAYQDQFVAGVDFLGAASLLAVGLWGVSFLFRRPAR